MLVAAVLANGRNRGLEDSPIFNPEYKTMGGFNLALHELTGLELTTKLSLRDELKIQLRNAADQINQNPEWHLLGAAAMRLFLGNYLDEKPEEKPISQTFSSDPPEYGSSPEISELLKDFIDEASHLAFFGFREIDSSDHFGEYSIRATLTGPINLMEGKAPKKRDGALESLDIPGKIFWLLNGQPDEEIEEKEEDNPIVSHDILISIIESSECTRMVSNIGAMDHKVRDQLFASHPSDAGQTHDPDDNDGLAEQWLEAFVKIDNDVEQSHIAGIASRFTQTLSTADGIICYCDGMQQSVVLSEIFGYACKIARNTVRLKTTIYVDYGGGAFCHHLAVHADRAQRFEMQNSYANINFMQFAGEQIQKQSDYLFIPQTRFFIQHELCQVTQKMLANVFGHAANSGLNIAGFLSSPDGMCCATSTFASKRRENGQNYGGEIWSGFASPARLEHWEQFIEYSKNTDQNALNASRQDFLKEFKESWAPLNCFTPIHAALFGQFDDITLWNSKLLGFPTVPGRTHRVSQQIGLSHK